MSAKTTIACVLAAALAACGTDVAVLVRAPDGSSADAAISIGGCADGEREGFVDLAAFPAIAGCGGGFMVPGVAREGPPQCDRLAGDDGPRPDGTGCAVEDLCGVGWHVCLDASEVRARTGSSDCIGATRDGDPPLFFVQRQGGAAGECYGGLNDLWGCGNVGALGRCDGLDRYAENVCAALPASWDCDDLGGEVEALAVRHEAAAEGGALCCRDRP